jgi:hypothetical protein
MANLESASMKRSAVEMKSFLLPIWWLDHVYEVRPWEKGISCDYETSRDIR